MTVTINTKDLENKINNVVNYSFGFLEGAQKGKAVMLKHMGENIVLLLKEYIDAEARSNQKALHHIYEWYQTGSPEARLYDFTYTVSNLGLSFKSNFSQSKSLADGSTVPFYNKAKIMEEGIPVTIAPKKSNVLAFDVNGTTVFTKNPVTVENPGGDFVQGSFEKIADQFFNVYFRQSFLRSSGLYQYIKKPRLYKDNFASGSRLGKSLGVSTGFKWIANAQVGMG
jgi:hypothetical protein